MEVTIPKTSTILSSLLRADLVTIWRNRRSVVMVFLVPIVILITWKGFVARMGGPFVLSTCVTLGLISIGLMGYTNSIARDRDKGIFQRLRVSPAPTWCIMVSRLLVQLIMIFVLTLIVFYAGYNIDHITLSPEGYLLTMLTAVVGGAVYLSLGQVIVGLIKNPDTVNSTTRLVYFVFIMTGMISDFPFIPQQIKDILHYSPYGTVKTIVAASMEPANWNSNTSMQLLLTVGYTVVFTFLGVKWFKWSKS